MELKDKKVLVAGSGKSGIAATDLLKKVYTIKKMKKSKKGRRIWTNFAVTCYTGNNKTAGIWRDF